MQTEQLLCWSGTPDPEHITSGSNKEEHNNIVVFMVPTLEPKKQCRT